MKHILHYPGSFLQWFSHIYSSNSNTLVSHLWPYKVWHNLRNKERKKNSVFQQSNGLEHVLEADQWYLHQYFSPKCQHTRHYPKAPFLAISNWPETTFIPLSSLSKKKEFTWRLSKWRQVNGDIMLLIGETTVSTLQVIPVTGILCNPFNFIPAVDFGSEFGACALMQKWTWLKL